MTRISLTLTLALCATSAHADWLLEKAPGRFGPYTGGHSYSYNVAYGYGFAFSASDTWRRDPFAYPLGVYPFRPYGRPILHRVFPRPDVPFYSEIGEDGLIQLVRPGGVSQQVIDPTVSMASPNLLPTPDATTKVATIHVKAPEGAEVWVEKDKINEGGAERSYSTPPLHATRTQIFTLRAKFTVEGKEVEQFRVVGLKGGETAKVTFGTP